MNVLYYCPEYYCSHGGRVHARGFYEALGQASGVADKFLYPKESSQNASANKGEKKRSPGKLWFLPLSVRRVIGFFVPKRAVTAALIEEIQVNKCDALVIRTGRRLPILRKIKRACPGTLICLEINSAYFDEEYPNLWMRSVFQKWEVHRFRQADAIVVVSSYLKSYLESFGICSEKIIVNHNGVDTRFSDIAEVNSLRREFQIPLEAFVIGYIGGMERFRRLPEVITYLSEVWRNGHDDIYLLIVGDGADMRAVREVVEAEKGGVLKDRVKLAGWRPHAEIPRFLATFDIAIFPFTNEYCSPLKLFEYLGAGVPAIGPDTEAVREVFKDGVHLKLVKQDGSDFIRTVLELKDNPQLRTAISTKGQHLVLTEYTWKRNAERVVSHIERMRAKHKY